MKQRIEYFDLLKGIAIFLVVMGHVITMCIRGIDSAFIFKLIGQVHMPVFFFISGYLTYKDSFAAPALKKRFLQLIVPFFLVSALWIWYFPHSSLGSPISASVTDMYCSFWKDGYWFTLCLFMLFLVYWPLSAVLRRCCHLWQQLVAVAATYAVLLFAASLWSSEAENFDIAGLGLLSWFFPIFIFGVFAKKYSAAWLKVISSGTWLTVAAVLFPLALFTIVYPWDVPFIPEWNCIFSRPLLHVSVVIIAVATVSPWSSREFAPVAGAEARPSIVARFFKYLGTESLSIYLLHYFFLFPLTPLQEPLKAIGLPFVPLAAIAAVVALCIVAVTLFVAHIIGRSPLLALLLLGKQVRK